MKDRTSYIDHVSLYKDTPELIKVITGVRRSGKSTIMRLYREHLLSLGIPASSIISINFEDFQYRSILTAELLHEHLLPLLAGDGVTYILLDEIQMVEHWETAVNSLRLNRSNDIYLSGSNAALLSGNMATLLSGRYVEIKVMPLSFAEYLEFHEISDTVEGFNRYLETGGLPGLIDIPQNSTVVSEYLNGVVNTIIVKDIAAMARVRDIDMLRKVIDFLASSIGQQITASKTAHYLTSTGRKCSNDTVDTYLRLLEDAYIVYRTERYNIKGKNLMKTNHKFYMVDMGLRNALVGAVGQDYGSALENLVFLELLRRGYRVTTGSYKEFEIDFIAERPDEKLYIQVCTSIMDETTRDREIRSLKFPDDNYPKLLLTMDRVPFTDFDGIRQVYIPDFLLSDRAVRDSRV